MAIIYSNNFDAETTGTLPANWSNVSGTWVVGTTNPTSGTKTLEGSANGSAVLYTGVATRADMEVQGSFVLVQSGSAFPNVSPMLRMDAGYQNGYAMLFQYDAGNISVLPFKKVSGSFSALSVTPAVLVSPTPGDIIHYAVKIVGSLISIYVWKNAESRPTSANTTITDSSVATAGYAGLYNAWGTGSGPVGIDNFAIDDAVASVATGITLTGPTSGVVGVASTNFTVGVTPVGGSITGTVRVTPSDSGGGGSFTPAFVDLTTGSPSGTFTYTPASAGAKTISVSNNGSLTNPSNITYTASVVAATAITMTGPTSGPVGVVSSNFLIGANGSITGTVRVTPSDSAGGGSFSPTFVDINTASPTGTFTYTPASAGAKTISVTNDGGLSNPSNITYTASAAPVTVSVSNTNWKFSPYNWDLNGSTKTAINGGAYFKLGFTGTSVSIGLDVSSMVSAGVASGWYPSLRYSVDGGPQTDIQLTPSTTALTVSGLASGNHEISVLYVRGWWENIGGTAPDRWTTPVYCIKVTGATIDSGATTIAPTWLTDNAIWFGDSISEGIRANNSDVQPGCQNAYESVPIFMGRALNCEMGNVSFGGQGYGGGFNSIPAFNSAYSLYSAGRSRLSAGVLSPAPSYVFIWHGANGGSTSGNVQTAITNMRTIAPAAKVCVIVPVGGFDRAAITAGVAAYLAANPNERKVYLIDLGTTWQVGLDGFGSASEQAIDRLHPRANWNARIASAYTKKVSALGATTTAQRTITLPLTTDGTTPAVNLTGLKWAFWDCTTPDAMSMPPSDYGVAETTDGSGSLVIPVKTSLASNAVGWLVVTDSNGTVGQNPSAKVFSGPVTVV